jgi:hypothetical protein
MHKRRGNLDRHPSTRFVGYRVAQFLLLARHAGESSSNSGTKY